MDLTLATMDIAVDDVTSAIHTVSRVLATGGVSTCHFRALATRILGIFAVVSVKELRVT
jgi:hypothetical protein